MLLTITTTHQPATDIGYLLHKNPANLNSVELPYGRVHVFYPEATAESCTAVLLLDIDPVALTRRGRAHGDNFALQPYVNDRPYVASSLMSVALSKVFGTLFSGTCKQRPHLVEQALPLRVTLDVLPCRGGEALLRNLFEPLGYQVEATRYALDEQFPAWGDSHYFSVTLSRCCPLREFLIHLYLLIPVLDNDKHYWIGDDEVAKLLKFGEGWLAQHPLKSLITQRYLLNFKALVNDAMSRLIDDEPEPEDETEQPETVLERKVSLNQQRLDWVMQQLKNLQVKTVVDMGCGEGRLLYLLLKEPLLTRIIGADVSMRTLQIARERLRLDQLSERQAQRIELLQTALNYRDRRLAGFDAATVIEVIEHLEPNRLDAFKRCLFEFAASRVVLLTTPNAEYNVLFDNLASGKLRHSDHRFEWTRAEFQDWASHVAQQYGYRVAFEDIGERHETLGAATQAAIFEKDIV